MCGTQTNYAMIQMKHKEEQQQLGVNHSQMPSEKSIAIYNDEMRTSLSRIFSFKVIPKKESKAEKGKKIHEFT